MAKKGTTKEDSGILVVDGITAEMEGKGPGGLPKTLILRVPLDKTGRMSKSGKSLLLSTTSGFTAIPGTDLKLGLNLISPVG